MARILIADDDRDLAETWRAELEREGHHVTVKSSGFDALASAHRAPPDVLVAELIMPGLGGVALAGRIKLGGPNVKVIVTTGCRAVLDPAVDGLGLARRIGADLTFAKPLTPEALAASIRALLAPDTERPGLPNP